MGTGKNPSTLHFERSKPCRWLVAALLLLTGLMAQTQPLNSSPATPHARAEPIALMRQAISAGQPYLVLSQRGDEPLTLAAAYQVQQALVVGKKIMGFKAGLTTEAGQHKFGVDEPIAGVLLAAPLRFSKGALNIDSNQYNRLMLELELGFVLKRDIGKPLASISQLKQLVAYVSPVIELPDLGFEKTPRLLGVDVIASNAAARTVIMGAAGDATAADLNALGVALYHNDQLILEGKGSDAMGDQWQALLWLINHSLKQGYRIEAGQLFITGALGKMLAASPGDYRATFAEYGELRFSVQ